MIVLMIDEQHGVSGVLASRIAGQKAQAPKFRQRQLNQRILQLVASYKDTEQHNFITGIAYNVRGILGHTRVRILKSGSGEPRKRSASIVNIVRLTQQNAARSEKRFR